MQLSGEQRIAAPPETVWAALNDPAVLQVCIPGCQSMKLTADGGFDATVRAKVGPVSALFTGVVSLRDCDPPRRYTLVGSGKGRAAGFAQGEAQVELTDDGQDGTVLHWQLEARVGGRLAQIGSRLVAGATRRMAEAFFGNFTEQLVPTGDLGQSTTPQPPGVG